MFIRFRFGENGGVPFCPRCGVDALYEYKCRDQFKCKACDKRFSPTSGTPWAYSKLSYSELLYMAARFCHAPDALSAKDLNEDLCRNYKTAFVWLHKFRNEVTEFKGTAKLGGEVEVDGGYFGGTMRPKNVKKERGDLRRIRYRDPEREMVVTFAVERGGSVRAWVAKREEHPRKQIDGAMTKDATVFTDSAPSWNSFRGMRRLLQVNHNVAFMTPEACTNAAESAIRSLRAAEDVHRHIAQNYLDLYAGEAGWRVTHNRARKSERFEVLMAMMARPGASPLTGYFAGKKRLCQIVDKAGEPGTWRPPTRSERDRRRSALGMAPRVGPMRPRRTSQNWHEGFTFLTANKLANDLQSVKDQPGVYVICLPTNRLGLLEWGIEPGVTHPPWHSDGYEHVYTGETYGLRTRLREHLSGSINTSNLRETLLALIFHDPRALGGEVSLADRVTTEEALSRWLVDNALIGFKHSAHVRDYERDILAFTRSPLNIRREAPTNFARWLQTIRATFRARVVERWEPKGDSPTWRPRR